MNLISKKTVLALLSVTLFASASGAAVLWDQSTIAPAGPGIANSNSPGFGGFVRHGANDVTVPAGGWHITSITQWYSMFNTSWTSLTQGYIYIQPKTGGLPTLAPAVVQSPMSAAQDPVQSALLGQAVLAVRATVNVVLAAGDYWIGLTPTAGAGINGANQQWPTAQVGDACASWVSPGPWTNSYAGWDGSFRVEGDVTVATEQVTWSSIKSLYQH